MDTQENSIINKDKFTSFYTTYIDTLLNVAFSYLKDSYLAEDVVQETFIKVLEHLNDIEEVDSQRTRSYLITIVKNKCRDLFRKKSYTQEIAYDMEEASVFMSRFAIHQNPLQKVILHETFHQVMDIIMDLPKDYRDSLLLHDFCEMTNLEIAEYLHISTSLVSVRVNRARKKVRNAWIKKQNRK